MHPEVCQHLKKMSGREDVMLIESRVVHLKPIIVIFVIGPHVEVRWFNPLDKHKLLSKGELPSPTQFKGGGGRR